MMKGDSIFNFLRELSLNYSSLYVNLPGAFAEVAASFRCLEISFRAKGATGTR